MAWQWSVHDSDQSRLWSLFLTDFRLTTDSNQLPGSRPDSSVCDESVVEGQRGLMSARLGWALAWGDTARCGSCWGSAGARSLTRRDSLRVTAKSFREVFPGSESTALIAGRLREYQETALTHSLSSRLSPCLSLALSKSLGMFTSSARRWLVRWAALWSQWGRFTSPAGPFNHCFVLWAHSPPIKVLTVDYFSQRRGRFISVNATENGKLS